MTFFQVSQKWVPPGLPPWRHLSMFTKTLFTARVWEPQCERYRTIGLLLESNPQQLLSLPHRISDISMDIWQVNMIGQEVQLAIFHPTSQICFVLGGCSQVESWKYIKGFALLWHCVWRTKENLHYIVAKGEGLRNSPNLRDVVFDDP